VESGGHPRTERALLPVSGAPARSTAVTARATLRGPPLPSESRRTASLHPTQIYDSPLNLTLSGAGAALPAQKIRWWFRSLSTCDGSFSNLPRHPAEHLYCGLTPAHLLSIGIFAGRDCSTRNSARKQDGGLKMAMPRGPDPPASILQLSPASCRSDRCWQIRCRSAAAEHSAAKSSPGIHVGLSRADIGTANHPLIAPAPHHLVDGVEINESSTRAVVRRTGVKAVNETSREADSLLRGAGLYFKAFREGCTPR
jgi:hypothetical protein